MATKLIFLIFSLLLFLILSGVSSGGEATKESSNVFQMSASVTIDEEILNLVTKSIKEALTNRLKHFTLKRETIRYYGMDITASKIRISDFTTPAVAISLRQPATVKVAVTEGGFHLCADWKARKGFMPLGGGHICMHTKEKLHMDVTVLGKNSSHEDGPVELQVSHCKLNSKMHLRAPGAMGMAVRIMTRFMQGLVQKQIESIMCIVVKKHVKALFNHELELNEHLAIKGTLQSFSVDNGVLTAKVAAGLVPVSGQP